VLPNLKIRLHRNIFAEKAIFLSHSPHYFVLSLKHVDTVRPLVYFPHRGFDAHSPATGTDAPPQEEHMLKNDHSSIQPLDPLQTSFSERFPTLPALVAHLEDYFAARTDVALALLFGSATSSSLRPDSDIDLAVAASTPFSHDTLEALRLELMDLMGRDVDLVDLGAAKGLILTQVLTKGIVLCNKSPELRTKLTLAMLAFQEDELPLLRRILTTRARRFFHGS